MSIYHAGEPRSRWHHVADLVTFYVEGMTMQVLVIGATGNTGFRIVRRLVQVSHHPVAMIRRGEQRSRFDEIGVPTVLADLEYPIDHAFDGCDAVIFAAGSGSKTGKDKTVMIDHLGAIRSMVAASVNGATRYIMLSSLNKDVHSESSIRHYHRAKGHADAFLHAMHEVMPDHPPLEWTIVCPGGLTDEAATGRVSVGLEQHGSGRTSRENLAAVLVACLDEPATIGRDFSLLDGETPIHEALAAL